MVFEVDRQAYKVKLDHISMLEMAGDRDSIRDASTPLRVRHEWSASSKRGRYYVVRLLLLKLLLLMLPNSLTVRRTVYRE